MRISSNLVKNIQAVSNLTMDKLNKFKFFIKMMCNCKKNIISEIVKSKFNIMIIGEELLSVRSSNHKTSQYPQIAKFN